MKYTPPKLKAVLWDIDGTLIDTTALIVKALSGTLRHFTGQTVDADTIRSLIGTPLEQQVGYLGDPSEYGTTVEGMQAYFVREYEGSRSQERIIVEAVNALIELKRRGILTALVTSKNDIELANTLPRLGISAYCDAIVGADQTAPYFKPHPRPVLRALELLNVRAEDAVFIGDTVHDVQCGRDAGVRTAAVLWGAATEARLREQKPDFVFVRPDEIAQTFLRLSGLPVEERVSVG
ncbi:MAG: HAD-IA family hydrolase [Capsulimonadaceae bacterium]|nr:HAD-IA family hydrolase [Capsulimonadaceae bacterium]